MDHTIITGAVITSHTATTNIGMGLNYITDRITRWGRERNIIGGSTSAAQALKLMSEIGELADKGIARRNITEIKDGIGDVYVVLAMIAGIEGLTMAECVAHAYEEIKDRTGVLYEGVFIKSTDLEAHHAAMVALGRWHPDSNVHGLGPDVGEISEAAYLPASGEVTDAPALGVIEANALPPVDNITAEVDDVEGILADDNPHGIPTEVEEPTERRGWWQRPTR